MLCCTHQSNETCYPQHLAFTEHSNSLAPEPLTTEKHRQADGEVVHLHTYTYIVDTIQEHFDKTSGEFRTLLESVVKSPLFPAVQPPRKEGGKRQVGGAETCLAACSHLQHRQGTGIGPDGPR